MELDTLVTNILAIQANGAGMGSGDLVRLELLFAGSSDQGKPPIVCEKLPLLSLYMSLLLIKYEMQKKELYLVI